MTTALAIILWSAIAATVAWRLAIRRSAAAMAVMRAQAEQEIRHWQDRASRERLRAGQLERELASWSEGVARGGRMSSTSSRCSWRPTDTRRASAIRVLT
jgi:hypothetical protein